MEETGEDGKSAAGTLKSKPADWLDVHGGFILLTGGAAMIALACLLADEVAVAPIFATFGCGLFVLAAFYSRIEGRVEASRQGFAAAVGAAQRLSRDRNFPSALQEEAVKRAVESVDVSSRKPEEARRAGEKAAMQAVDELASRLQRGDLAEDFTKWLVEEEGFPLAGIEQETQSAEGPIDLLASKDDEALIAEISTLPHMLNAAHVARLVRLEVPGSPEHAEVRKALVIPSEQKDELQIAEVAQLGSIEIYGISIEGNVERLQ